MKHVQSCCFANLNLLLSSRSRCHRHRRCLTSLDRDSGVIGGENEVALQQKEHRFDVGTIQKLLTAMFLAVDEVFKAILDVFRGRLWLAMLSPFQGCFAR